RAIHAVMFDRSDPITRQQAQRVQQVLHQLMLKAPLGYRFDIYTFEGDTKSVLSPILSLCSPGRPEDANEWTQNRELMRKRYNERFSEILDRTIDQLLKESTRDNSPIIESIKAAAITSFGPIQERDVELRLTLVSDMVQHSALYSHFKVEPN